MKNGLFFPGIPEMEVVRKHQIVQHWKEASSVGG